MLRAALPTFDRVHRLRGGAVIAPAPAAMFRITGPGALACLQGLWTNDLLDPGEGALAYGALLTPKGMIVSDGWAFRVGDAVSLLFPPSARAPVAQIFRRSLPPRLATAEDLSESARVLLVLGDAALERWPVVPLGRLPEEGRAARCDTPMGEVLLTRPASGPFSAALISAPAALDGVAALLEAAGMAPGGDAEREAARILAGWPALGAEIDDRTLPQEVGFDEHGGVSYTKGCYTGQETVARLHFRGHANRVLRGLRWQSAPPTGGEVTSGGKQVGHISSVLALPDRVLGLAVLRRELKPGNRVTAGDAPAIVTNLPFGPAEIEG
jgi:tRNA-modifying protein YgfZ